MQILAIENQQAHPKKPKGCGQETPSSSLMTRTPGFKFPVCSGSWGLSFLCFMFNKIFITFITYFIKLLMCLYKWKEVPRSVLMWLEQMFQDILTYTLIL